MRYHTFKYQNLVRDRRDLPLFFIIVFIIAFHFNGFSQDNWSSTEFAYQIGKMDFKMKRVLPPSPEAASLGQYGNTPVSLFTGTPKISIPLYELKGNKLSLPVSLNYNASGFKPQEIAPWVGLGWSLNAGGVITRSVMGNPDDNQNYFNSTNNYLDIPPTNDEFANYDYMKKMQDAVIETQPDVYYYNFGNYSGKFVLKTDGTVVKKEKNNLKINYTDGYFSVIDDNGNVYSFTELETSTTMTDDAITEGNPVRTYIYTSSWFLSSITSADGVEKIFLNYYTTGQHKQFANLAQNVSVSYNRSNQSNYGFGTWSAPNFTYGSPPASFTTRKYLNGMYLLRNNQTYSYINFNSVADQREDLNDADFPGERLLQSIQAYTKQTASEIKLVKQFDFLYGYFSKGGANPGPEDKRLKLNSVQEISVSATASSKPPYYFYYTGNTVPSLYSSIDHWGFGNAGDDPVTSLVPSVLVDQTYFGGGANREPDFTSSTRALLNMIKYPTGGYTTFEYELNQGVDVHANNQVKPVGGVRIKTITDYSFDNSKAITKNYEYKLNDGTTSGQADFPRYESFSSFHFYTPPGGGGSGSPSDYDINYINVSSNSVAGLGFIQGSHIAYSQVTEFQTDVFTGRPLGKTVYNYHVAGFNTNDDFIGDGDLEKLTVYDNTGKILYQQDNSYNYMSPASLAAYTLQNSNVQDSKNILCKYDNYGTIIYTWKNTTQTYPVCLESRLYKTKLSRGGYFFSGWEKQLISQTEKKYDQLTDSYITSTKTFTYGNSAHTLPTRIDQTTGNGELVTTTKKYPLDYNIPTGVFLDNASTGIELLQTKNIVGAEIESVQLRQNPDGTNKRYISGLVTTYYPTQPYPQNIYRIEAQVPLATLQSSAANGNGTFTFDAAYKLLGRFKYDASGNLNEQSKASDITQAYIYDYYGSLPIAEVNNATNNDVAYTSFESNGSGNWVITGGYAYTTSGLTGLKGYTITTGDNISKSGLNTVRQYIVSYWSRNGVLTVSNNNSTTVGLTRNGWTYYEHLLTTGISSVSISATNATIDELRFFPTDAQMATVAYVIGLGEITRCSPTNQLLYYEYDGLNRLLNVKDDEGNIVKNYRYNYGLGTALTPSAQTLFYNDYAEANFTRQASCPPGTEPTTVTYKVPYGKFVSSISLADANAKAAADIAANGQTYANTYGICLYWNVKDSGYYSKNNCAYDEGISVCSNSGPVNQREQIKYIVPAHTYSSEISQADANAKAHNDVLLNGQNYANQNCWCSCTGEGKKFINGTCESGVRFNSSTTYVGGVWKCVYYYEFSDGSVSQFYTEYNASSCPVY